MAVYYKMDMVNYITYFSGTELDYSYAPFDPYAYPNPTADQKIIIQNHITLEGQEGISLFEGCSNETIEHLDWIDTSQATDFMGMFANCNHLRSVDLSTWDTSNVTRMSSMFYMCGFLQSVDLRGWNVSNLESCSEMFYDCNSLTEIKTDEDVNWRTDAPNLNDDGGDMFSYCSSLPKWHEWNTNVDSANTGRYFTGIWTWSKTAYEPYEKVDDNWEEIQVYIKEGSWQKTEVYR